MSGRLRGFTLVELLVVISIIALLVALLLPTLASARKAARIALCGSQLRQHGVALNAYQVDFGGYYPLFGGPIGDVGGGRTGNMWATFLFDSFTQYAINAPTYNAYGGYINLPTGNGLTPTTSTAPIKFCPVVDWFHYGPYTYINPGFTPYASGAAGYSYYTGRCLTGSTILNFNTVNRRDNPRELLMTDLLMQPSQNESDTAADGTPVMVSTTYCWFNPHVDRSCQIEPTGSGNHLASDGHVVGLTFRNYAIDSTSHCLSGFYAYSIFTGSIIGPPTSLADGPYAITP